jgi:hypothetical protein
MGLGAYISGWEVIDYHTETAATVIDEPIQAQDDKRLALASLSYLSAATAHTISFMFAKDNASYAGSSRNTTSALAVSGQKDIVVTNTPRDPAGNAAAASDIIAYQITDGTWEFNTIASVATKTITLTNNIAGVDAGAGATAIAASAKVMIFGVVGDGACLKLQTTASVQVDWIGTGNPILIHPYIGEPFYVTIDNATNAGFLMNGLFAHIDK